VCGDGRWKLFVHEEKTNRGGVGREGAQGSFDPREQTVEAFPRKGLTGEKKKSKRNTRPVAGRMEHKAWGSRGAGERQHSRGSQTAKTKKKTSSHFQTVRHPPRGNYPF